MTENDLLRKITDNGWTILMETTTGQEGKDDNILIHKAVSAYKPSGDVLERRWFKYYVKADGSCYWQEFNPFPIVVAPEPSFTDRVKEKIDSLISDGVIKAGYIEKLDEITRTASIKVAGTENEYETWLIYQNKQGVVQAVRLVETSRVG